MAKIGAQFIELTSVDSTNIHAMNQIHAHMAKHGHCYLTHEQTVGKGQRGKVWNAKPRTNITMSVVLEPKNISLHQSFFLSAAVAMACYDIFNKYAGDETSVKWPNDIYWRDRKAGGILIENIISGQNWLYAVAGIGININQTEFPDNTNAVSLKQITGKTFDYVDLAHELCEALEKFWHILIQHPDEILNQYNSHLFKKNEQVLFKQENRRFPALVKQVNAQGEIELSCPHDQSFAFGSIQWIIE